MCQQPDALAEIVLLVLVVKLDNTLIPSTKEAVSYTHLDVYKRQEFIIGTENSILQHLQYECPEKSFYPLSKDCVCHNMKPVSYTHLDVYKRQP